MKITITAITLCLTLSLSSQNGTHVEYKMSSTKGMNGTMKMNYSEYGSATEFNMVVPQMPGGGMVIKSLMQKSNPDIIYTINEQNKTYTERIKGEAKETEDNRTYEVKKLGEEKVNGYKCVHALVTEGKETHEVWNTKDIADYDKYAEAMASNKKMASSKREKALKDAGCEGMPVKFIHKGNEREGDVTTELVKLEKKSFSKSDFELPAGYTKSEGGSATGAPGVKSQSEIMNMSPEERAKYIEEMKKKYGK